MNSREEFLAWAQEQNAAFLSGIKDLGRYARYQYARGASREVRVFDPQKPWVKKLTLQPGPLEGVFIAVEGSDGSLKFGWSSRHPTKEGKPFNKIEGLYRAIKRIGCDPETIPMRNDDHLHIQFHNFMKQTVLELQEKRNERAVSPVNAGE
jgi:hypothetical protein